MDYINKLKWAKFIMFLAAVYNLFWGFVISLWPSIILFDSSATSFMLIVLRCVGMLVGVYGIAYYFASLDPKRYWPLILVGLIGKVLGPIGAVYYVVLGKMQPDFLWVNVFNDLVWLYPFSWILYQVYKGGLSTPEIVGNKTLYQKFLGDDFDRMADNLKRFHGATTTVRVAGEFKVTRGTNLVTKAMANLANLPYSTDTGEAELIVSPSPNSEVWSRRIDDKKVISKQWLEGGYLVERFKVVEIYLDAKVEDGELIIFDVASTVMGISMPPFFTPKVWATGRDEGDGVLVNVEIGFKPFGRIINYWGVVRF
jgi:hypothetical protein